MRVCTKNSSHVETRSVGAKGHTPGAAIRENEVASTCTVAGSYDEVVYCSVCGTHEISRETKTLPLAAHTPGTPVEENVGTSTCTVAGTYEEVVYCSVCGTHEISRETKTLPLADHTPGTAVRENEVAATCETGGSYDEVVYCSACGTYEISRENKTTGAKGHLWDDGVVTKKATYVSKGEILYTCKRDPNHTYTEEIPMLIAASFSDAGLDDVPKTGDSRIQIASALTMAVLCGFGICLSARKRRA